MNTAPKWVRNVAILTPFPTVCANYNSVTISRADLPVTTRELRLVPVERLIAVSAELVALRVTSETAEGVLGADPGDTAGVAAELRRRAGGRPKGGEPKGHDVLLAVAAAWEKATADGDPSRRETVGEKLGYSPNYIGQLVNKARKQGLLPPAPNKRKGR